MYVCHFVRTDALSGWEMLEIDRGRGSGQRSQLLVVGRAALAELTTYLGHGTKAWVASACHCATLGWLLEEVTTTNMILANMVILEHSELLN